MWRGTEDNANTSMLLNKTFKIVNALNRDTHNFTVEFNLKLDFNMKLCVRIST